MTIINEIKYKRSDKVCKTAGCKAAYLQLIDIPNFWDDNDKIICPLCKNEAEFLKCKE